MYFEVVGIGIYQIEGSVFCLKLNLVVNISNIVKIWLFANEFCGLIPKGFQNEHGLLARDIIWKSTLKVSVQTEVFIDLLLRDFLFQLAPVFPSFERACTWVGLAELSKFALGHGVSYFPVLL